METHEKMWEVRDTPLLFIESIHRGDTEKMPAVFGIKYSGHYFIVREQTGHFYRNRESYERAKLHGREKYSDMHFVDSFHDMTLRAENEINSHLDSIGRLQLGGLPNDELLRLWNNFFNYYSTLVACYRSTRPEFYELLTNQIMENIPEPKQEIMARLLSGEHQTQDAPIREDIKALSLNLHRIGKRRFALHQVWQDAFMRAGPLFEEIGKRANLNLIEAKNCLSSEIGLFLANGIFPKKEEIQKRLHYFRFEYTDAGFNLTTESKDELKTEIPSDIRGQCASPGKARGRVALFAVSLQGTLAEKIGKMNKGDVLVATSTSPDMIAAIEKASAIVTDEGGLLCHAAIVSRELKIPCIIGTGSATTLLKDGDYVEVDANSGAVKRICPS